MASQWIARAVTQQAPGKQSLPADDAVLYKDRPAITEFMTLIVDDEGNAREPSVIMIVPTAGGCRVGIKDDDAEGWLWREAETFVKGLNAIEKALQSGDVKWTQSKEKRGKKK